MRRLLFVLLAIIIGLAALIGVVRAVAMAQPSDVALMLRSSDCEIPCWRGIMPGRTSLDEASTLAHQDPSLTSFSDTNGSPDTHMRQVCWTMKTLPMWQGCAIRATGTEGPVDQVHFIPNPDLHFKLGDVMAIYGEPLVIETSVCAGSIHANLFFADDVEITAYGRLSRTRLDPAMQVGLITYHFPAEEPPYPFDAPLWRGFVTLRGDFC